MRAPLLADGPGDLGPISELLEGVPWPVRAIVALVMVTSPWWVPKVAARRPKRQTSRRRRHEPTPPDPDTEDPRDDEDDLEQQELRQVRATLIGALEELSHQRATTTELVSSLQAKDAALKTKDAALTEAHRRAVELERSLADRERELTQCRDQVDYLIGRRERTPPHGQPQQPTDSTPPPAP